MQVSQSALVNTLKRRRERAGLSQLALAARAGITRQALIGIEGGRQVPSTRLALGLARALGCGVDDLFKLAQPGMLEARTAPMVEGQAGATRAGETTRLVMGRVCDRWVVHRLAAGATVAADALTLGDPDEVTCSVQPLADLASLASNVLVAGCAPLLGMLLPRMGTRYRDARGTWVPANSGRALDLLDAGLVHAAGVHLFDEGSGQHNLPVVRARFSDRRMLVINLTRWQQGLVVARGNPLGIRTVNDLLRPEVCFVRREAGSGAAALVERLMRGRRTRRAMRPLETGPSAHGHEQVARMVSAGVADVGVAIEGVALAAGLDFIPLAEERFDLVLPAELAVQKPVQRFIDALDDLAFRMEVRGLPGYDDSQCGQVITVDAA